MSIAKFDDGIDQLFKGIEYCLQNQLPIPALQLLYAAMDIMGSLNGPQDKPSSKAPSKRPKSGTRFRFQRWVRRYMIRGNRVSYRAVDLYAARCGILHECTPNSDLVRFKLAKKIAYSWGNRKPDFLEAFIRQSRLKSKLIAVDIDYLYAEFKAGVTRFKGELSTNPKRQAKFIERADELFSIFITDKSGRVVAVNEPQVDIAEIPPLALHTDENRPESSEI